MVAGCKCGLDDVKSGVRQLHYSNDVVNSSSNNDVQNNGVNVNVDLMGSEAKALWEIKMGKDIESTWIHVIFQGYVVIINRRKLENY